MDEKLLSFVHMEQRRELDYRRGRESDVFTWSNSILMAAIGGLLVIQPSPDAIISGLPGKVLATLTVALLTRMSISWQLYHASAADDSKRIITRLGEQIGAFRHTDEGSSGLYSEEWKNWGQDERGLWFRLSRPSRIQATFLLGLIAGILIWIR